MFNSDDIRQIESRGSSAAVVERQIERFKKGFPWMKISAPATPGKGIAVLSEKDGTKLIVEIKEHSTVERNNSVTDEVLRMVSESGLEEKVEYICFHRDVCRRIASSDPDALVGYLSGDSEPGALAEEGIRCIDYPFATLNTYRYMIKDAHSLGMKVNVWTVNTDEDIMSSIALGVDYITTDCPDRVMEICSMLEE